MGTLLSKRCFSFAALDILCLCVRLFYMETDMIDRDTLESIIRRFTATKEESHACAGIVMQHIQAARAEALEEARQLVYDWGGSGETDLLSIAWAIRTLAQSAAPEGNKT
jgi:hypothetical protein